MHRTVRHSWTQLLVVATAALLAACAEGTSLGPDRSAAPSARSDRRGVELGACPELEPPAGSVLASRMYARGVQIYRWNGTGWTFVGPSASLHPNANAKGVIGTHYAGPEGPTRPVWESNSGGTVVGAVVRRCTPDAAAIPWLLLDAVATDGPGIFHRVTSIQRLNTVGGLEPARPGSAVGEVVRVPYTTEYLFYRAR